MRGVAVWSVIAAWVLDACSCIESESLPVSNWLRKPSYGSIRYITLIV